MGSASGTSLALNATMLLGADLRTLRVVWTITDWSWMSERSRNFLLLATACRI